MALLWRKPLRGARPKAGSQHKKAAAGRGRPNAEAGSAEDAGLAAAILEAFARLPGWREQRGPSGAWGSVPDEATLGRLDDSRMTPGLHKGAKVEQ